MATRAPAAATAPATRQPPAKLCRNARIAASFRRDPSWVNPAWLAFWAAMTAPPADPLAAVMARAGSPAGSAAASRLVYREAATLPMTATPS